MSDSYDVIVIGGGPAGCTTATVLAQHGRKVLLLEKEPFPRYHVGESLMPFCYFTLERLGMIEAMEDKQFTHKHSVGFVTPDGRASRPFFFFQHYDHPSAQTWQVERQEFDQMLFENARKHGVDVRDGVKVKNVLRDDNGTVIGVATEDTHYHAKVTVDATGRDALLQTKNGWRRRDPELNKIAVWTYFKGAKRDPGLEAGSTTVAYLPEKGWFWYIPLKNDLVSVGAVAERDYLFRDGNDPAQIIARETQANAWIADHLKGAEQTGRYWTTGEYSYRSEFCAEDGAVLVGDAFAFLDPVFSSGVFLALKSGEMAADTIHHALENDDVSAKSFDAYGNALCSHVETMRKIVYSFYDEQFSFADVIKNHPDLRGRLTDCLIGDVSKNFDGLFGAMAEFAQLPTELAHGKSGKIAA